MTQQGNGFIYCHIKVSRHTSPARRRSAAMRRATRAIVSLTTSEPDPFGGLVVLAVFVNGVSGGVCVVQQRAYNPAESHTYKVALSTSYQLNAGDYVELAAYRYGPAINIVGSGVGNVSFGIVRLP